ncbi:putative Type I phosphodiesterase/nucleotide pyrophosphatase/phosphate transferase [Plasmopara halstedii]
MANAKQCRQFLSVTNSHDKPISITKELLGVDVQHREFIILRWQDGKRSKFHLLHLRTWCPCPQCGHLTGQRIINSSDIDKEWLDIEKVYVKGDTLNIVWNDHHESRFSCKWLLENSYSDWALDHHAHDMATIPLPLDAPVPTTDFARMMDTSDDEGLYEALRQVVENGFTVIRNTPLEPRVVKSLAERIAPISHSFQYGDVFDVVAEPTPVSSEVIDYYLANHIVQYLHGFYQQVNIAYTTLYLKNHVDLAYYESPPGFQLLHALRFDESVTGGESTFVDVFAVADAFRRLYPQHFATLVRVPATFKKHHLTRENATIMEFQRPHIQLNHRDEVIAVHWSPPFEGPLRVAFKDVMPYYDAYRVFHELVEGDKHRYEFRLREGDTVIFNQRRLLHGRKKFTPTSGGVRHLQGTYINIDDALCRYNVLRARFGANDPSAKNRRMANNAFCKCIMTLLRYLCVCAGLGAYLCSSGLLRLNEVFFQSSSLDSLDLNAHFDQQQPKAAYDRLVIVLIDALRADMVLCSTAMRGDEYGQRGRSKGELNVNMPFTSSLVTSGRALGYVAHASVPTVTMPRLKALVTGKAPIFIDILKNFNSAALDSDANLLSLFKASGKRIVFYGDDTWLRLFPKTFIRSDGTSGFYTKDTVEVDVNVTRHLSEELDPKMQSEKSGDWDVLVLHYLGLDHVGHLRGPRSSLMTDKLQEMDQMMKLVVKSVRDQDTHRMEKNSSVRPSLIVLCSDHGMSEVGNHGGATLEESSALLMFMRGDGKPMHASGFFYEQKRSQVDLVPTISSLFGFPIPLYSTGLLLEDVVRASSDVAANHESYYLHALYHNFQQLYALARTKFLAAELSSFDQRFQLPLKRLRDSLLNENGVEGAIDQHFVTKTFEACQILRDKVQQSDGSEYNPMAIFGGLMLLMFSMVVATTMLVNAAKLELKGSPEIGHLYIVLGVGSVLHILSLSSSSLIENEHATVFFMTTSLLVTLGIILIRQNKFSHVVFPIGLLILSLILTRMLRQRNQIINFWRLNELQIDANIPGNEFALDNSVSILSTSPMLSPNILPLSVSVALICGVVLRKGAVRVRTFKPGVRFFHVFVGISSGVLFIVGMLACYRVKELSDQTTMENNSLISWTGWMSINLDSSARVVYICILLLAVLMITTGHNLRTWLVEMVVWLLVGLLQRRSNFPTLSALCLQLKLVETLLDCEQARAFRQNGVFVAGLMLWLSQAAFFALDFGWYVDVCQRLLRSTRVFRESVSNIEDYTQNNCEFTNYKTNSKIGDLYLPNTSLYRLHRCSVFNALPSIHLECLCTKDAL